MAEATRFEKCGIEVVGKVDFFIGTPEYYYRVVTDGMVSHGKVDALHVQDGTYCITVMEDTGMDTRIVSAFATKKKVKFVKNYLATKYNVFTDLEVLKEKLEREYQAEVDKCSRDPYTLLGYELEIIGDLIHCTKYRPTITLVDVIDINGNLVDQYDCDPDKEAAFYASWENPRR